MKSKTMYQRVWLNPDSSLLDHGGALFHFSAVYVSNSGPRLFQSGAQCSNGLKLWQVLVEIEPNPEA